jgi:hypothetical protein
MRRSLNLLNFDLQRRKNIDKFRFLEILGLKIHVESFKSQDFQETFDKQLSHETLRNSSTIFLEFRVNSYIFHQHPSTFPPNIILSKPQKLLEC